MSKENYEQTDDTATDGQLAELYAEDVKDRHDSFHENAIRNMNTIGVCDGEWRREGTGWRFWRDPARTD